jgi:multidrug transporter EmrE-like cation transporter
VTLAWFLLLLVTEGCTVAGQIFFKRAMGGGSASAVRWRRPMGITAGIAAMAIAFFIWLGLLKHFELSYLFPFEGFDRIILAVAAGLFLKERVTQTIWIGVVLIVAGTVLVSLS